MIIRNGRRGQFLGCSGYPKCKNTGEVPAKLLEEMGLNGNGRPHGERRTARPSKSTKSAERRRRASRPDPSVD